MRKIVITVFALAAVFNALAAETVTLSNAECRLMAIDASEDIRSAVNSVDAAKLDKAIAHTAYLPNLSGNATAAYNPFDTELGGARLVMKGTYMAGLTISQPIYAGGKIVAGNRLAKVGIAASEEQLRMAQMNVISEADNAYWTYIAVLQKVKMVEAYMAQMDTLYNVMDMRRQKGFLTQTDLLRVDARRSEVQYQLQKCRNGADLCRLSLCRIIGVSPDTEIVPVDTIIEIAPPTDFNYSVTDRPEYKLLCLNVDASRHKVNMTLGDFLPTVGLSLGYTHYGNIRLRGSLQNSDGDPIPLNTTIYSNGLAAMIGVKIPLFHWGEGYKKVKKARIEVANAQLDLEKNTRLLDLEIRQAISNLTSGYAMIETAALALRQAEANLKAVNERFSVNMVTLTDLLDAESQWHQSYSNAIEAKAQYRIFMTEYRRVTGTLTELSDLTK